MGPALVRQISYSSSSLVIYEPIRDFYQRSLGPGSSGASGPTYVQRLMAGGTAGGIAISIFNPAEVVKTQVQSNRQGTLRMRDVISRVWAADGLAGFWAGVKPNVARTFFGERRGVGYVRRSEVAVGALFGHWIAGACGGLWMRRFHVGLRLHPGGRDQDKIDELRRRREAVQRHGARRQPDPHGRGAGGALQGLPAHLPAKARLVRRLLRQLRADPRGCQPWRVMARLVATRNFPI